MNRWSRKGFTVVELVIVVIVVAILTAIVVVAYRGITGSAQEASMKSDLQANAAKVTRHKVKNGSYPISSEGTGFVASNGVTLAYDGGGEAFCISLQDESRGKIFSIDESEKITSAGCAIRWKSGKVAVNYHTCGISVQDQVFCWGRGDVGQIGNGNTNQRTSPTLI